MTKDAPEWSFQSPNFTHGFYPDLTLNVWLIRVDEGFRVAFDFDVLEIAENDRLHIGNGKEASDVAYFTGENIVASFNGNLTGAGGARVMSGSHEAWLRFQTYHVSSCRGFSVTVRQEKPSASIAENGRC